MLHHRQGGRSAALHEGHGPAGRHHLSAKRRTATRQARRRSAPPGCAKHRLSSDSEQEPAEAKRRTATKSGRMPFSWSSDTSPFAEPDGAQPARVVLRQVSDTEFVLDQPFRYSGGPRLGPTSRQRRVPRADRPRFCTALPRLDSRGRSAVTLPRRSSTTSSSRSIPRSCPKHSASIRASPISSSATRCSTAVPASCRRG